jgi:cold shock CspA family protein
MRIRAAGYRSLNAGEHVQFEWEECPAGQDGYFYRATRVIRGGE